MESFSSCWYCCSCCYHSDSCRSSSNIGWVCVSSASNTNTFNCLIFSGSYCRMQCLPVQPSVMLCTVIMVLRVLRSRTIMFLAGNFLLTSSDTFSSCRMYCLAIKHSKNTNRWHFSKWMPPACDVNNLASPQNRTGVATASSRWFSSAAMS